MADPFEPHSAPTRTEPLAARACRIVALGVLVWLGARFADAAERIVLERAARYPSWLALDTLGDLDAAVLERWRSEQCPHRTLEIFQKQGHVVLRCGYAWSASTSVTVLARSVQMP